MAPQTRRDPVTPPERTHGPYAEQVVPRLVNLACGTKTAEPLRRRVCDGLIGNVVEVGFGSGLNVPFYPSTVTAVAAVEPSDTAWKLADKRLRATHVPVRRSALDAQTCPTQTTASTRRCRAGACARSLTLSRRCRRSGAC